MRQFICAVLVAGGLVFSVGCQSQTTDSAGPKSQSTDSTGGVAVIDLDEVARRLGHDIQLGKSYGMEEARLTQHLASLQEDLQGKFKKKKQAFGDEPTDEQQGQLRSLELQLNNKARHEKVQAQTDLTLFRQRLINRFRERVKPVAREVAANKGLSIVLAKDESLLLTIAPAVEITDAVIAKMLADKPADSSAPIKTADKSANPTKAQSAN